MLMNVQLGKCFFTLLMYINECSNRFEGHKLNHSDIYTPVYLHCASKNKPQFLARNIIYCSYSKNNSGLFFDTQCIEVNYHSGLPSITSAVAIQSSLMHFKYLNSFLYTVLNI